MANKERIEAAIEFMKSISFGGDYEEAVKIKAYVSIAVEALQQELSKLEVSE